MFPKSENDRSMIFAFDLHCFGRGICKYFESEMWNHIRFWLDVMLIDTISPFQRIHFHRSSHETSGQGNYIVFIKIRNRNVYSFWLFSIRAPLNHLAIKYSTLNFDCMSESQRVIWFSNIKVNLMFTQHICESWRLLLAVHALIKNRKYHCKGINLLASLTIFIFIYLFSHHWRPLQKEFLFGRKNEWNTNKYRE